MRELNGICRKYLSDPVFSFVERICSVGLVLAGLCFCPLSMSNASSSDSTAVPFPAHSYDVASAGLALSNQFLVDMRVESGSATKKLLAGHDIVISSAKGSSVRGYTMRSGTVRSYSRKGGYTMRSGAKKSHSRKGGSVSGYYNKKGKYVEPYKRGGSRARVVPCVGSR